MIMKGLDWERLRASVLNEGTWNTIRVEHVVVNEIHEAL